MKKSMEIWEKFVSLPGAVLGEMVGIASEQAIKGVIAVIRKYSPHKILELGAGIGTLTYAVLDTVTSQNIHQHPDYSFYTVENNAFCLENLPVNLKDFDGLYTTISSTEELPSGLLFDFIIVDGGGDLDNDMGVMFFGNMLAQKGVVLVEGARSFQRDLIEQWYDARTYVYVKMPSIYSTVFSNGIGKKVKNKPYHLFVFEPRVMDAFIIQLQSVFLNGVAKLQRVFISKNEANAD